MEKVINTEFFIILHSIEYARKKFSNLNSWVSLGSYILLVSIITSAFKTKWLLYIHRPNLWLDGIFDCIFWNWFNSNYMVSNHRNIWGQKNTYYRTKPYKIIEMWISWRYYITVVFKVNVQIRLVNRNHPIWHIFLRSAL